VETSTKVRPERKSGRRKATYGVMVENKANAPVLVALEGEDPDGELQYGFNRPPTEIPPGETVQASMQVRPPKQIWIGRPQERRFSVTTLTGEAAEERLAEEPMSAEELRAQAESGPQKRRWWKRRGANDIPGVYGPRVYKPQVYAPGLQIGPSGISLRKPQFRGPQMSGPQMKGMNFEAAGLQDKLKRPGGAPAAPTGPLLPSQAVFRQKPWLPWWLVPVVLLLAALAVMLYLLLPQNVVVPDVVGSASAFEAEEKLTEADLTLAPAPKEKVDPDAEPGSVVSQTPKAGDKAEKGEAVTIEIAVGDGQITVPKVTGLSLADAEAALREKKLSLGQTSPQPPDPDGQIESQIPAENEIVKEGAPVDVFFADPNGKGEGKAKEAEKGGGAPAPGGGEGGEGADAEIIIPAIDGAPLDEFAQKLGDDGLVPIQKRQFDDSPPNTLFATEPPGGTTVKAGTKVTLLVSAGFPQLAFDDDNNIRLVNGANGDKFDPIANARGTREKDPAWSPDGTRVAYAGDGRVFLKELKKEDAPAVTLTGPDEDFNDLSWAPTADLNLLAMSRVKGQDRDLCLGQVTEDGMTPRCIADPKVQVGTVIRWRPDGKEILAFGVEQLGTFGMVRYRSKKAFSPDPDDWKGGKIVTDTSKSGEGVLDASYSPDGSRMAIVSNQGGGPFQVFLAKRGDVLLTSAKPTDVRACQAIWRTDGRELVVVQKDEVCSEPVGDLARFPVNDPSKQTQLNASGDNPVFQPLTLGG
jgi:beta-lactam-binding protein with PASTA domain